MRDDNRRDEDAARAEMRQAILCAFCRIMQTTRLRPMTVLGLAATAVGMIYKEIATAHRHIATCPCGWEPQAEADVARLQTAVAAAAHPAADLRWLKIAGRA
jgi:hypothetical protein